MITREDLGLVVMMAELTGASSEREREALWALKREIVIADSPDVDVYWLMESDPKRKAGA